MSETDHDLMERCRAGDRAAFEALLRRWQPCVIRLLTRLHDPGRTGSVHPTSEIDDLAQEVFLRVLSAAGRYRSQYAFSTWLYRIVLNVARDAARRRRTRWKLLRRHRPQTNGQGPVETAGRKEIEHHVADALGELPAKLREPLVLRHHGDLTFTEAAEVLRLPVSTVKSRVHAGLLKLRNELKRRGIGEEDVG